MFPGKKTEVRKKQKKTRKKRAPLFYQGAQNRSWVNGLKPESRGRKREEQARLRFVVRTSLAKKGDVGK